MTSPSEEGDPSSRLLVLGQAPSHVEMRLQRPLVGPSGDVLRECLHQVGVARSGIYILNVWEEQVESPKNSEKIYERTGGRLLWDKKGFTELGLEKAQPTLQRIRASGANCILALGQQALTLTTGKPDRIMKWRGSILPGMERAGGRKVVATVHPAATIHGVYLWRYLIISDAGRAVQECATPELVLPLRNIITKPTIYDIRDYINECRRAGRFATDLEVINHQVSCFSLSITKDEALVVPFHDELGEMFSENEEILIWQYYGDLMYDDQVMKINQNIAGFDAPFLAQQNKIITRGKLGDTMLAQQALYPEFNKGLDFICSIHTREPYYKDEGKMWKNHGGDFDTFWRYNGKDSCTALEAWDVLAAELTQRDMWETYNNKVQVASALCYMTLTGLDVDQKRLAAVKDEMTAEADRLMAELDAVAEHPFNPNSPKQCAQYFYETKRLTAYRNAAGGVSTDDTAMSRIYRKTGLREAKLVQEIRNLKKLIGTYLEVELDGDSKLRCSWNPGGTWTGRLSSGKTIFGTGLNLQNLDPRFKGFIVSKEQPDGLESGGEPVDAA